MAEINEPPIVKGTAEKRKNSKLVPIDIYVPENFNEPAAIEPGTGRPEEFRENLQDRTGERGIQGSPVPERFQPERETIEPFRTGRDNSKLLQEREGVQEPFQAGRGTPTLPQSEGNGQEPFQTGRGIPTLSQSERNGQEPFQTGRGTPTLSQPEGNGQEPFQAGRGTPTLSQSERNGQEPFQTGRGTPTLSQPEGNGQEPFQTRRGILRLPQPEGNGQEPFQTRRGILRLPQPEGNGQEPFQTGRDSSKLFDTEKGEPDTFAQATENPELSAVPKEKQGLSGAEKKAPVPAAGPVRDKPKGAGNPSFQPSPASPGSTRPKALTNEEVMGHTASLWKYLPIPDWQPEPMPEYISSFQDLPGSRITAARVRGKKHKHEGTNCDDWYEVANFGEITFIAVSDGAGSKKFSRIGARESCKAAVGYLTKSFKRVFSDKPELSGLLKRELSDPRCIEACGILAGIVQQSVIKAVEAVEAAYYSRAADQAYETVLKRELEFKDLSATLLLTVLIPVNSTNKEHLVITCQIGDGMIALLNTKGRFSESLKLMGVPDSGDFSGETEFLTSSQMRSIETLQGRTKLSRSIVDTVLVMSDGVADDYFPNETEMRRLYFDLVINGILRGNTLDFGKSSFTQQQMKLFKRIPDPLAYPWVNDQSVKVGIQYTKRICQTLGLSLEDIWNDPAILELARMELEEDNRAANPGEQLKIWLDNYVERGSFDDRTLVIAQM